MKIKEQPPLPEPVTVGWDVGTSFCEADEPIKAYTAEQMRDFGRACAQAARAWQPIETAPREGTVMLSNSGGCWVGKWEPVAVSGYVFDQPWRSMMLNHWHIPSEMRYMPPTHWMPLPAPPSDQEPTT